MIMDMRTQILASAQRLVQQRGFNGFSYADIAEEVGIRKASLHHHFPSKADLGKSLIEAYTAQLENELRRIDGLPLKAGKKLNAYVAIYRGTLEAGRVCLGGMLASDWLTLDASMLPVLKHFFAYNTKWLTGILAEGKAQKQFIFHGSAEAQAFVVLSTLQGALLIARATGDRKAFDRTTSLLLMGLSGKG